MGRENTVGYDKVKALFVEGTFSEIGAYIKRAGADSAYDGIVCGYGSVSGKLAFAFIQDSDRTNGAFDEIGAKKIEMLYDMAIKNGAAVIGIFDSAGAVVAEGSAALSAYGRFMSCVAKASGIVPQIALYDGLCTGMALTVSNMFDLSVNIEEKSELYLVAGSKEKCFAPSISVKTEAEAYAAVRTLVEILPQNNKDDATVMSGDDAGRAVSIDGLSGKELIVALCDNASFTEIGASCGDEAVCGFAFFGGRLCGVVASNRTENGGKISGKAAKKIASLDKTGAGIKDYMEFKCGFCRMNFVRGIFLSRATVTFSSGSNHLEFRVQHTERAKILAEFLTACKIEPKTVQRRNAVGIYYKKADRIEDVLNLMQANNAFFEVMNRRIERDIIVQENRAVNCESVNIAKSVATAQKQLRAIEIIQNAGLLEKIGHELTESAKLRLEHHSSSLSELASMHEPPITKSTLNNRFAKIMQMAENIANKKS
jgi:DNA-binding transcriptional regulator WhiA